MLILNSTCLGESPHPPTKYAALRCNKSYSVPERGRSFAIAYGDLKTTGGGGFPLGEVRPQHPVDVGGTSLGSVCRVWEADGTDGLAIGALHKVVHKISCK